MLTEAAVGIHASLCRGTTPAHEPQEPWRPTTGPARDEQWKESPLAEPFELWRQTPRGSMVNTGNVFAADPAVLSGSSLMFEVAVRVIGVLAIVGCTTGPPPSTPRPIWRRHPIQAPLGGIGPVLPVPVRYRRPTVLSRITEKSYSARYTVSTSHPRPERSECEQSGT